MQAVNDRVFIHPDRIDQNIRAISQYFKEKYAAEPFAHLIPDSKGNTLVHIHGSGYYRVFDKITNAVTLQVVQEAGQAYQAAYQFAAFTQRLSDFPIAQLQITIPDFHNLSLRYSQFENALRTGNTTRIKECQGEIEALKAHKDIVRVFEAILNEHKLPLRVIHHDTKISNVLFDENFQGVCPIDLDTVMPGYIISDVGDMMRTYLSPVDENSTDIDKIRIRKPFYQAIINGYTNGWQGKLSTEEIDLLPFSGSFIIYMQALRFMTDYLLDDHYYGASYPGQNRDRSMNQIVLLHEYRNSTGC